MVSDGEEKRARGEGADEGTLYKWATRVHDCDIIARTKANFRRTLYLGCNVRRERSRPWPAALILWIRMMPGPTTGHPRRTQVSSTDPLRAYQAIDQCNYSPKR